MEKRRAVVGALLQVTNVRKRSVRLAARSMVKMSHSLLAVGLKVRISAEVAVHPLEVEAERGRFQTVFVKLAVEWAAFSQSVVVALAWRQYQERMRAKKPSVLAFL